MTPPLSIATSCAKVTAVTQSWPSVEYSCFQTLPVRETRIQIGPDVTEDWPSGTVIVRGLPVKVLGATAVTVHDLESAPVTDKSYVEDNVQVSLYG